MKKIGEILEAARKEKGWTVAELAQRTKIQDKFLQALERSDFNNLPEAPFVKGFIRTVAGELGLKPDGMVAIFRRDYDTDKQGNVIPRGFAEVETKKFSWTPKMTVIAAVAAVVGTFSLYLIFQIKLLVSPPTLILDAPKENAVVGVQLIVEGRTDPSAEIFINDQQIRKNKSGVFSQTISLLEGVQTVAVKAVGQNQKSTTVERTIQVKKE